MFLVQGLPQPPCCRDFLLRSAVHHSAKTERSFFAAILDTLCPCGGLFVWAAITCHLCHLVSRNLRGLGFWLYSFGGHIYCNYSLKIAQIQLIEWTFLHYPQLTVKLWFFFFFYIHVFPPYVSVSLFPLCPSFALSLSWSPSSLTFSVTLTHCLMYQRTHILE